MSEKDEKVAISTNDARNLADVIPEQYILHDLNSIKNEAKDNADPIFVDEKINHEEEHENQKKDEDIEAAKWLKRENGEDFEDQQEEENISKSFWKFKIKTIFQSKYYQTLRDFGFIFLILSWWIPSMINKDEKVYHRRIASSIISWFLILFILFHNSRYLPKRPISNFFAKGWNLIIIKHWNYLPFYCQISFGWLSLASLILGTTFGLPKTENSNYIDRLISLTGLIMIYGGMFIFSKNHKAIQARTTILGVGFQFIIALFVFRTQVGSSFFNWISQSAFDLLNQGVIGGAAFFWGDLINDHHFFINTLSRILTWIINKSSWFFYKTFLISGAEAVVAVASPFLGQGENVILVRPYIRFFTRSEFHQVLVSGFATIAGSILAAYIALGVNGKDLITSSVMSIPASIAASKLVYPETQESETQGHISIIRQEQEDERANDVLHALSNGAWFGAKVAALVFANVLVIVSLVHAINGFLTYIGNAWYITESNGGPLTLDLIVGYLLWPITFMLGTPKKDCLKVSKLIATKIVQNEFVAYVQFTSIKDQLSERSKKITTYALCGFGNFGSVGIIIGVLSAIAPKRRIEIIQIAPSALITGIFVTLSSAAIAGIITAD